MVFKKFRIQVIIRLIIIASALGFLLYYLLISEKYIRSFYLVIFLLFALVELFYYIDRSNRNVATFFQSILNSDFTFLFDAKGKGRSFQAMYEGMNLITKKFREINSDKEIQYHYLQTFVEQANVGLISFNESGKIHLINTAFREMLDLKPVPLNSSISDLSQDFHDLLERLTPGKRELITLKVREKLIPFVFIVTGFRIRRENFTLISVQNIRKELDEKELEAWQKLIRVLTHEIMNSATPITSLSSSLYNLLQNNPEGPVGEKERKRIITGLEAIQDRSSGLMKFTQAYQTLTRIPQPQVKPILIDDLVHRIEILFKAQLEERKIAYGIEASPNVGNILGDINLLDQALVNLIKNSIEALENRPDPSISIVFRNTEEGKVMIRITDNGVGMDEETREQIFVPFFTTKAKGSGIGLSLCKQIIRLHGGLITVESVEDQGTTFTILI